MTGYHVTMRGDVRTNVTVSFNERVSHDTEWETEDGYRFYGVKTDEEITEMRNDPIIVWINVTYRKD